MSPLLLVRSPDLRRLREEGYEVSVSPENQLVVDHIPCVTSEGNVAYGSIVSELNLSGDQTGPPSDHVVQFVGPMPCDRNGRPLPHSNGSGTTRLRGESVPSHSFSSKPNPMFANYYDKVTNYANMFGGPAQALDSNVCARTYASVEDDDPSSVFHYLDTGPGRSGISGITDKVARQRIGIVGLGGTGSYIFDLVAKTPVSEIHLFDRDVMYSHNAFRSPGAASLDQLRSGMTKVEYYRSIYVRMRSGVVAHPYHLDDSNVTELANLDFVFISMDPGPGKRAVIDFLIENTKPFIDTGLGVYEVNDRLSGVLRVTAGTPAKSDHVRGPHRVDYSVHEDEQVYDRNIQIAEFNALTAALAVVKWKKLAGVFLDLESEHFMAYTLDGNLITNEDQL